jgi:hypothetical protein
MARKPDNMVRFEATLAAASTESPWTHTADSTPVYVPNLGLLERLLTIAVREDPGTFPKAIDLWIANELRRAGFTDAETWPRATRPRVLSRDVARLLDATPRGPKGGWGKRDDLLYRVIETPGVSPTEAVILGRAYDKQVDVCISRWDTGPEVLISTKAQLSSFAKNLPNRFEEAYGDAANLRARYPLAAVGYFFVQRATILTNEPKAFERAKDMVRKLRAEGDGPGYTATALLLVEWDDVEQEVRVVLDPVPAEIRPDAFLAAMIERVLAVTPVTHHVEVREHHEGREIPVEEEDPDAVVRSE